MLAILPGSTQTSKCPRIEEGTCSRLEAVGLKFQSHQMRAGEWQGEAGRQGRTKTESAVIGRVAENEDSGPSTRFRPRHSLADQRCSDAAPAMRRQHGHGSKAKLIARRLHTRKHRVADDFAVENRDEREDAIPIFAQAINKIGFCVSRECLHFDTAYARQIGARFDADVNMRDGRHGAFEGPFLIERTRGLSNTRKRTRTCRTSAPA